MNQFLLFSDGEEKTKMSITLQQTKSIKCENSTK